MLEQWEKSIINPNMETMMIIIDQHESDFFIVNSEWMLSMVSILLAWIATY